MIGSSTIFQYISLSNPLFLRNDLGEILKFNKGWLLGPPWVLGILGEWLFVFRELGSTGNYFQGFREHAHSLGGGG